MTVLFIIILLLIELGLWVTLSEAWGWRAFQRFLELPPSHPDEYQKILKHKAQALGFGLRYEVLDIFVLVLGQLYARLDGQIKNELILKKYLEANSVCKGDFLGSRPVETEANLYSTFNQVVKQPDLNAPLLILGLLKLFWVRDRDARKLIRILERSIISHLPPLNARQCSWLQNCLQNPELSSLFSPGFKDYVRRAQFQRFSWQEHSASTGISMSLSKIYNILEIRSPSPVADTEVRSAYLRLMRKLHPDKLRSQNLPDAEVQAKLRHAQEVQLAFQTWKRRFADSSSAY